MNNGQHAPLSTQHQSASWAVQTYRVLTLNTQITKRPAAAGHDADCTGSNSDVNTAAQPCHALYSLHLGTYCGVSGSSCRILLSACASQQPLPTAAFYCCYATLLMSTVQAGVGINHSVTLTEAAARATATVVSAAPACSGLCGHSSTHGVDLHTGLPPVHCWLDQLHLHPAHKHTGSTPQDCISLGHETRLTSRPRPSLFHSPRAGEYSFFPCSWAPRVDC